MTSGHGVGSRRLNPDERRALVARIVSVPDMSSSRVELRHLRHFVAVAEELHFGRAATRLNLAQPALSQSVISLEKAVGAKLLERTTRTVVLTSAGRVFLDECRRVLTQVAHAVERAQEAERGEAGLLRIGYVASASYEILPPILVEYRKRSPGVALRTQSRSTSELTGLLLDGDLSMAFIREFQEQPELDSQVLFDEELVAVLPSDHPAARASTARLADLAAEPFILFDRARAPGLYDKLVSSCVEADFAPDIVQQSSDVQSVLGLVAGGLGVTIVPSSFRHLSIDGLTYRSLSDVDTTVTLSAVWPRNQRTSVLDGFIEVAVEVAARRSAKSGRRRRSRGGDR
jgi:DNA-binding transcriptional LysR family regulator